MSVYNTYTGIYIATISQFFLPSSTNIVFNGQQILYPLKQKNICDFNPICIISSGLMFNNKIMNIFSNKAVNQRVEVIDSFVTKIDNNNIYMYRDSLQDFYWKKGTH